MKVLIGTPAYGGQVTTPYFQSILSLIHSGYSRGIQVDVMTLTNESLITRGRNEIVATFMAGDWTDLLWVDADIEFNPEHAWRLLDSPYEVCATPYPMKGLDWEGMARVLAPTAESLKDASRITVVNNLPDSKSDGNGFSTFLDAGTGFMRVKRSAVEKMIAAYPHTRYEKEGGGERYALFDCVIHEGRYLSEDYTFCRRWQLLDGEIWCDVASPSLGHQGSYKFGR